jgi:HNH endonuclease
VKGHRHTEAAKRAIGAANRRDGAERLTTDGYVQVSAHDHPYARTNGTVLKHRLVVERRLGRFLLPHEKVHHIDGVKTNNADSNLALTNASDHSRSHAPVGRRLPASTRARMAASHRAEWASKTPSARDAWLAANGDVFETRCEMLDVTSNHRPDTAWRHTDAAGHVHQWHVREPQVTLQNPGGPEVAIAVEGQRLVPADAYSPAYHYEVPTLAYVQDGVECWDGDDEPHTVGHLECPLCGEHVAPGYCADTITQLMPGLRSCYINGVPVSRDEFERRLALAKGARS